MPNVWSRFTLNPLASVGAVLTAYRSTNLVTWTSVARNHVGLGQAIAVPVLIDFHLDSASAPSAFYHVAHTTHPESLGVSHLRSRTLTISYSSQTHTYRFDGTGLGGTISVQFGSNQPVEGPFVVDQFSSGAHHLSLRMRTAITYGGANFNPVVNCGWDELISQSIVGGRQFTTANVGPIGHSPCTVTR